MGGDLVWLLASNLLENLQVSCGDLPTPPYGHPSSEGYFPTNSQLPTPIYPLPSPNSIGIIQLDR
jgi:hypothetical protein